MQSFCHYYVRIARVAHYIATLFSGLEYIVETILTKSHFSYLFLDSYCKIFNWASSQTVGHRGTQKKFGVVIVKLSNVLYKLTLLLFYKKVHVTRSTWAIPPNKKSKELENSNCYCEAQTLNMPFHVAIWEKNHIYLFWSVDLNVWDPIYHILLWIPAV